MDESKLVSFIEKTEKVKINKITCANKQVGPDFESLSSGLLPFYLLLIFYLSVVVFSSSMYFFLIVYVNLSKLE